MICNNNIVSFGYCYSVIWLACVVVNLFIYYTAPVGYLVNYSSVSYTLYILLYCIVNRVLQDQWDAETCTGGLPVYIESLKHISRGFVSPLVGSVDSPCPLDMYISMYVHTHVCMYACMYVCMYVCMHIYRPYAPIGGSSPLAYGFGPTVDTEILRC